MFNSEYGFKDVTGFLHLYGRPGTLRPQPDLRFLDILARRYDNSVVPPTSTITKTTTNFSKDAVWSKGYT